MNILSGHTVVITEDGGRLLIRTGAQEEGGVYHRGGKTKDCPDGLYDAFLLDYEGPDDRDGFVRIAGGVVSDAEAGVGLSAWKVRRGDEPVVPFYVSMPGSSAAEQT